jgi:HSP20 family protein
MALLSLNKNRNELARIQNQMDELFSKFTGGYDWPFGQKAMWPPVDISDREDEIIVNAEVPGCNAEDIDISVQGNVLTISGEKKEHEEIEKKGFYHVERFYGTFRRDITLPSEVDSNRVNAVCKNGVLSITMQKSEKAKAKHIKVLSSGT